MVFSKLHTSFICFISFAGALLPAQVNDNKGRQLVDQAVQALGGDNFLHMRNRMASGRVYAFFHDQMSGLDLATIYTEYLDTKPANGLAVRERELLGKKQDYSYLFLPDQGWDITYRGARPVDDERWDRYKRSTENDILYLMRARLSEPGLEFDYVGSDVNVSAHVEVVEITDAKGQTIRVLFDHNTKLPLRATFKWLDPETHQHNDETTSMDKYRDIGGGIKWPLVVERERNGYKAYQIFAAKVEANVPVPAKTFDLPPGAKVLKKVD
jgi:hypothetical protein